jgi:hypothetical protein
MTSERAYVRWGMVVLVLGAATAHAQQPANPAPTPSKGKSVQAIEIRGQVPTPQVVTVRPRQIPIFSREVLTPAFFDRHFWESLTAPYEIVPDLATAAGTTPVSWTAPALPADSSHRPPAADSSGRPFGSGSTLSPSSEPSPRAKAGDEIQGSIPNAPREK